MADTNHVIEKIAAARPTFSEQEIADILPAVQEVLESGWLILGEHTDAFENAFKKYVGVEHAVAVNTCSSAIQITLRFFGPREILAALREAVDAFTEGAPAKDDRTVILVKRV